ncbi:MAG: gamma-glutamylcyclotransferase, partial [Proteobacteria bacterium]|nr:gamma-glutamylcyclotransferase [Pseudomonadota bacterium]
DIYAPRFLNVCLEDGRGVQAYSFIVRHGHEQYSGDLDLEEQARLVKQGTGTKGSALDYLANTLEHLDEMGLGGNGAEHRLHDVYAAAKG